MLAKFTWNNPALAPGESRHCISIMQWRHCIGAIQWECIWQCLMNYQIISLSHFYVSFNISQKIKGNWSRKHHNQISGIHFTAGRSYEITCKQTSTKLIKYIVISCIIHVAIPGSLAASCPVWDSFLPRPVHCGHLNCLTLADQRQHWA